MVKSFLQLYVLGNFVNFEAIFCPVLVLTLRLTFICFFLLFAALLFARFSIWDIFSSLVTVFCNLSCAVSMK